MRSEIVAADRRFEVRRAATLWRKSGLFDTAMEGAVAARFADDRVRTTRLFRGLFFCFTWFGFSSAYGLGSAFFMAALGENTLGAPFAAFHIVTGIALLIATELLHTQRRLRRFGIEEALVWLGLGNVIGGGIWLCVELFDFQTAWLIAIGCWASASLATLAAWRWGTPWTGYAAALGLFAALTQAPASHLVIVVAAALFAWPLAHLSVAAQISPEGRRRFREAFVVVSLALYLALHVEVVEGRLFDHLRALTWSGVETIAPPPGWLVALSGLAMLAMPLAWIGAGLARRFRPALDLGLFLLLVSVATHVVRARPEPQWLVLALAGGLLGALALVLRRLLARREGAEWRGLTALPLADDQALRLDVETFATLAALSPAARDLEARGFGGEGGEFGGGGASARF